MASDRALELVRGDGYFAVRFRAMASPCEVLVDSDNRDVAERLARTCATEAWRVEDKFSRYRQGNIVDRINRSDSAPVRVDEETSGLIGFALTLHELSGGLFDITSGALREVWLFDGGDHLPFQSDIDRVLPRIGAQKLTWTPPVIRLASGMQIDLGGVGKEYAVDRAAALVNAESVACLINFGGDLCASRERDDARPWRVGIETTKETIELTRGAIATSGDARRFVLKDGVRYGHILDPRTGWPVAGAPRSLTVVADTCTQAGMLATLAMLKGGDAERFLAQQGVLFWCDRGPG